MPAAASLWGSSSPRPLAFGAVHAVRGLLGRNLQVAWRSMLFTAALVLAFGVV